MIEFKTTESGIFYLSGIDFVKIGIAGKAVNQIDYSGHIESIRKSEKSLIRRNTGIAEKDILLLNQLHKDNIILIDKPPEENEAYFADADGMLTNINRLCLVIRTADCVPVFALDPKKNILGTVHSGWKGSRLFISRKLVRKMKNIFGSKYRDIHVFILPSIGPDSYAVNDDVAHFFNNDIINRGNRTYLNLWNNIESSLVDEGIYKENIINTRTCTLINSNDFFSHRNNDSGRNLNFAYINFKK